MNAKIALLLFVAFATAASGQSNAARSDRYALAPCDVTTLTLAAGVAQSFTLRGTCNVPDDAQVTAADLVLVVTTAAGGTLKLWEEGVMEPSVTLAGFDAGTHTLFSTPRLCAPFLECGPDLNIKSSVAATVAVKVQGYYREDAAE